MFKIKETVLAKKAGKIWNNRFFSNIYIRMALLAILVNLVIEALSRHSLIEPFTQIGLHPFAFFYNCLLIFFTLSIADFFYKRIFVRSIVCIVWLILGAVNCIILICRKTPFTAPDMLNAADAVKILPHYVNTFQLVLIIIAAIAVVALLVMLAIKSPKFQGKINFFKSGMVTAIAFGAVMLLLNIGHGTGLLPTTFGNIMKAYDKYGLVYCFTSSVFSSGISEPDNYSQDTVNDLVNEIATSIDDVLNENTEVPVEQEDDYPNIIFVQLESLFDPTHVTGLEFSEDPLPNLHNLYENYTTGFLSVPVFGAGTVNTEFEIMTGMNIDDFGPGEYPYKTVLRNSACESIAYYLKDYGYTTNVLHNNTGSFYQRNTVMGKLGYDTFTSLEYIESYDKTPNGWAKDYCLIDEIIGMLDKSEEQQDYIYAISVQGHGDYPEDTSDLDLSIEVTGDDGITGNPAGFEYYVNQINEMDDFVGKLIEEVSARDEKTIVVFYGDHLPPFDFTDEDVENGNIYQTEYVIWDNFGLSKTDRDIEAFQMSSFVMSKIGLAGGVISKYHQTSMDSEDSETYLSNLTLLEYDILYGDCDAYDGESPYSIVNLHMGYKDITISGMRNVSDHIIIDGENFTGSSKVQINGEIYTTTFVDGNQLMVEDYELETDDRVVVVQVDDSDAVLSSTSIYVYSE